MLDEMKKPRPVKHPSMSSIFDSDSPRKRKINQSSPPHISLVRDEAASGQRVPGGMPHGSDRRIENHLASEGAEAEVVEEAPAANLAGVRDALPMPRLGSPVQKHDLGAVYDIRLNARYIYELGHL